MVVEEQVCRRFRSSVHFSKGCGTKEFFLVSRIPLPLSPLFCSSVGLALQCYIRGVALDFRVLHLGDRNNCFSVASNKVGHFIYHLKDRIWPDFVCHFNLFSEHWRNSSLGKQVWAVDC